MTKLHLAPPTSGRRSERARPARRTRRAAVALAAAAALTGAACGGGGGGSGDDDGGAVGASDAGSRGGLAPEAAPGTTAVGAGADDARTIEVAMADNRFSPASVEVAAGETVTFAFTNEGTVTHDAVVGDEAAQAAHEDEMGAAGSTGGGHGAETMDHGSVAAGDEAAITVEPGDTGELTHTFAAGDELLIGCHEPGHYDAGMRIDLAVSPA